MKIIFKAKPQKHYSGREIINIKKKLTRSDVVGDHPHINSSLMNGILSRISAKIIPDGMLFTDAPPEGVTLEAMGFLTEITIECSGDEWR